jgi:mannose-6-phosphate isomerase-like protein (cupin superfamily)
VALPNLSSVDLVIELPNLGYCRLSGLQTETAVSDDQAVPGDSRDRGEFLTRERCYIRELVNDQSIHEFSLAEARVEPGVCTELHRLSVAEWYLITAGSGIVEIGDSPAAAVSVGDIVAIPAGRSQRIRNTGHADLRFQCICLPRFTPECYESLE